MTQNTTHLPDNGHPDNDTKVTGANSGNVVIDWISTWSYARENSERLMLYSLLSICLGLVLILLFIIIYLIFRPHRHNHRFYSLSPKSPRRNPISSISTQTTSENASLLSGARSPGCSVDGPSPRLADPSSSPSTLRSLRVHSGPMTVGGEPVWTTIDRQRSVSPTVGLYTNPYRHDTFRTIESRSSKLSPRK